MKAKIALIAFLLFFFSPFLVKSVFATVPTITAYPSGTLSLDTSFTVTATMSGLSKNAIYRLRVAISQSGTSNYFGSTYDGATWHMGSLADGNYISVTTDGNGAWGGDIQGKIDSDDPNFTTGSGTYDLKIGRYTQTGSTATWSDPNSISIIVPPTLTPTNTPTPIPTSAPAPTSTPVPTNTPTPKPTPTSTPTPSPTFTPSPTTTVSSVLGESIENTTASGFLASTQEPTKELGKKTEVLGEQTSNISKIFIGIGVIFFIACAILFFRFYINNKKQQEP